MKVHPISRGSELENPAKWTVRRRWIPKKLEHWAMLEGLGTEPGNKGTISSSPPVLSCRKKLKVVLKLDRPGFKGKQKAMETVSSLPGVESISWDWKDEKMTVTGDIDPVKVLAKLRKLCPSAILSVGPAKEKGKKKEDLQQHCGGRRDAAAKSYRPVYNIPGFYTPDCLAGKSFTVLETLPNDEQPIDCVPLLYDEKLTLEGCVQQEKSPNLPRVMQINGVEQRMTEMPRYLGGLTSQAKPYDESGQLGLTEATEEEEEKPEADLAMEVEEEEGGGKLGINEELCQEVGGEENQELEVEEVYREVEAEDNGLSNSSSKEFTDPEKATLKSEEKITEESILKEQEKAEEVIEVQNSPIVQLDSSEHHAPDNIAHLLRALQSGPVVFSSEKKDTGEGLNEECLTKSVLSLGDSTKRNSYPNFDATENKAHLVRSYQSGPVVSLSANENRRETLKRKCITRSILDLEDLQQHCGSRRDDAAKSFGDIYDPEFHATDSLAPKSFALLETLPTEEQPIDCVPLSQGRLTLEGCAKQQKSPNLPRVMQLKLLNGVEQRVTKKPRYLVGLTAQSASSSRQNFGARRKDAAKGHCDSLAWKSSKVLDILPLGEQSNKIKYLAQRISLTHKHCVRLKKSPDLPRSLQRDSSRGLAAQSAISLSGGGHILSLSEKKIVKNPLKRKCRNMSVLSLEDHQQHADRRWEDAAKFLGAKRICRQLAVHCESTPKRIHRQHGAHRWPFKQSAIGLPDGGHTLCFSKKIIVRKTLKRKCRTMSVLCLEYHQHVDSRWEDVVKSLGAKRIRSQHGINRWPFLEVKRNWATMNGYSLRQETLFEVMRLSADGNLSSRLQRIHISWLGRFSPRPSALPAGGEILGSIALSSSKFAATNNGGLRVGQDQSGSSASHSKKKRTREQEDREEINRSIGLDDLRQCYGMKRTDAAEKLGVSVSTLKRTSRLHGIERWPNKIRKKVWRPPDSHGEINPPPTRETLLTNGQIEVENNPAPRQHMMATIPHTIEGSDDFRNLLSPSVDPYVDGHVYESINRTVLPSSDPALSQPLPTSPHTTGILDDLRSLLLSPGDPSLEGDVFEFINNTVPPCPVPAPIQPMLTNPLVEVKAIYGDDTIKFPIPLTSGIKELKEEVSKTLERELGSLKVAYMDYSGEWILMARDENVREYLELVTSLGNQVTKLKVRDKVPNSMNVCETCGCKKDHSCA